MENDQMRVWLSGLNETAMTPIQLRVILFFRFFVMRLTGRIKLSNASGHFPSGIWIGKGMLNMAPKQML